MFGLLSSAFSAINAVRINNVQKQSDITNGKLATLTCIRQILEAYLEHLTQDSILLNGLRYNAAVLVTAAQQIVLQTADIMHKVKSTIQQAQNNRLSTKILRGE
jgi:hypothetical protein